MTLFCGAATYCADKDALRGTLFDNMKEIRPTVFLCIPRVWEKMQEEMGEGEGDGTPPRSQAADREEAEH